MKSCEIKKCDSYVDGICTYPSEECKYDDADSCKDCIIYNELKECRNCIHEYIHG